MSKSRTSLKMILFSLLESGVFEQQVLFWADFLSVTLDLSLDDPGWVRGQNLGHFYLSNHWRDGI